MRKLIKKLALALFRGRYAPRSFSKWLVLLFDCCLFFASFWIYVFIKYIYHIDNLSVIKSIIYYETFHLIPLFVFFLINAFIFGSYQGLVRYSGFGDINKIAYVSFSSSGIILINSDSCAPDSRHKYKMSFARVKAT